MPLKVDIGDCLRLAAMPVAASVEIVERKGTGHPDSIRDARRGGEPGVESAVPRARVRDPASALGGDELVGQIDQIDAAECYLVSQIGRPIGEPQVIDIRLRMVAGASLAALHPLVAAIVAANLGRLDGFADELLDGRLAFDRWPFRTPGETADPNS